MTTTTLTQTQPRITAPRRSTAAVWGRVNDAWAMTRRNLVHISREPMQLSDVTIQPVLFTVLFIYIFGGGIPIPGGGDYKDFVLAGLLALNLVTSTMGTAVGLSTDLHEGMIDRFRTLPMWRAAVLVGRSIADLMTSALCALIVALTALAVGCPLLRLLLDLDRGLCGPEQQEPGVRCLVRIHCPVPAGVRLKRYGADPTHARMAASSGELEPRERGHRRRPPPVGQPEPLRHHQRLADATSRRSGPDLVRPHPGRGRALGLLVLQTAHHGVGSSVGADRP
jgi:hypothetical protein